MALGRRAAALLAVLALLAGSASAATVTLCHSTSKSNSDCAASLESEYPLGSDTWACITESDDVKCLDAVKMGKASVTVVGGNELFLAQNQYSLAAYVGENYGFGASNTASYFGLSVVKSSQCNTSGTAGPGVFTGFNKASLEGKDACSTGYRKTAGWVLPVGKLFDTGIMSRVDTCTSSRGEVNSDACSVTNFFNKVCASRTSGGPVRKSDGSVALYPELCDLCAEGSASTDEAQKCSQDQSVNNYADYTGAFHCMTQSPDSDSATTNKPARVAFVKQATLEDYKQSYGSDTAAKDYRILCSKNNNNPNGYCLDWPSDFANIPKECINGESATNALVATRTFGEGTVGKKVISKILEGGNSVTSSNLPGDPLVPNTSSKPEYMWSNGLKKLYKVNADTQAEFKQFFQAYGNFKSMRDSDLYTTGSEVKVCMVTSSNAEVERCTEVMNGQYNGLYNGKKLRFSCKGESTADGCMKGIKNGNYHVTQFGGDEQFLSHYKYGLVSYIGENYGFGGTTTTASYFGIAVVKASECGPGKKITGYDSSLKGKSACNTGYRKTAGWVLPVGKLLALGLMDAKAHPSGSANTDAYSYDQFFGRSCAPRTTSAGPGTGGTTYAPMCELCKEGGGSDPCSGEADKNPYSGYTGAFKCMDAGAAGDRVAFVKHTTLDDYNKEFSTAKKKSDYRILCSAKGGGGGTGYCTEFPSTAAAFDASFPDECKTGESAAQAVIARADFTTAQTASSTPEFGKAVIEALYNGGKVKYAASAIDTKSDWFWSREGKSLYKYPNPKDFTTNFQPYANFKSIRSSDENDDGSSGGTASATGAKTKTVSLSNVDVTASDIDARNQKYRSTVASLASSIKSLVQNKCDSSCGAVSVTVDALIYRGASRRRNLLASNVEVVYTTTGATDAAATINKGDRVGAATATGTGFGAKKSDNKDKYKGRAIGLSIGLFFAGVLVTAVVAWMMAKKASRSRQFADTVYGNQFGNPASDGAAAGKV